MGKFKIWEILLFVAVVLLAALVYEIHNVGGRYIPLGEDNRGKLQLDSRTGAVWVINHNTKEWKLKYPAIPKGF